MAVSWQSLVTPELAVCALLSLGLGRLRTRKVLVWFLLLPGTLAHELAHWGVAVVLWANPGPPNLIPSRQADGSWVLGHVTVSRLRWWSAAPVALAPLTLLVLVVALCRHGQTALAQGHWGWAAATLAGASSCLCSAWPSRQDWKIASLSLPAVALIGLSMWALKSLF